MLPRHKKTLERIRKLFNDLRSSAEAEDKDLFEKYLIEFGLSFNAVVEYGTGKLYGYTPTLGKELTPGIYGVGFYEAPHTRIPVMVRMYNGEEPFGFKAVKRFRIGSKGEDVPF